jgi:hypothetical protein
MPCVVRALCAARPSEPFSENAAQVKRLINRDRKEFLGNSSDILDKYQTEFGADAAAAAPTAAGEGLLLVY